jgi:hypothetical protein
MSAVLADVDDANIRQRKTIREGRAYQIER